jgi:hypothetical protein
MRSSRRTAGPLRHRSPCRKEPARWTARSTPQGNLQLTGLVAEDRQTDPSQVMNLTVDPQGHLLGGMTIETSPNLGDNAASASHNSATGPSSWPHRSRAEPEDHDIWLRRYPDDDGNIVFQGPYNLLDEPRRVRVQRLRPDSGRRLRDSREPARRQARASAHGPGSRPSTESSRRYVNCSQAVWITPIASERRAPMSGAQYEPST